MMGLVRRDVVESHMPRIERAIPRHEDFFPFSEGTNNFDGFRLLGLSIWQAPAENFAITGRPI